MISNLIENALKYSPAESKVHVSVKQTLISGSRWLIVDVMNDIGTNGIPDKQMIFSRFYRNPLALEITGSGVGLYLVHALVQRLNGQINYEASETKVSFRIQLPEAPVHD